MKDNNKILSNHGSKPLDRADWGPTERLLAGLTPPGQKAEVFVALPEAERLAAIHNVARPPLACGPDVIAGPARGAMLLTNPMGLVPDGTADGWKPGYTAYRGRSVLVGADIFDVMAERARAARRDAPFTPGQIAIARHYRALVEGQSAGGMKCSSLDGRRGGGQGEFMDAYIRDGMVLSAMQARIGIGVAMAVRRVRPSARGAGARVIGDRALVDMVCLAGASLSDVLKRFGWSNDGKHREALRTALSGALDRMQGYGVRSPQNRD